MEFNSIDLKYDNLGNIETVKFDENIFEKDTNRSENYFMVGSYCLFISKLKWDFGLKFFIIENKCYQKEVINNLFEIQLFLFINEWCVKPIEIFKFIYKEKINWGIKTEKAENSSSGKLNFDKAEFRDFCLKIKGLNKDEPRFEEVHGKDWFSKDPSLQFYVGNRNLFKTALGKTVLIDIDPRWSWKKYLMNNIIWRGNTNPKRGFGNMTYNLVPNLIKNGYSVNLFKVPYPEEGIESRNEHLKTSINKLPIINCVNDYSLFNHNGLQLFFTASEGSKCSQGLLSIENRLSEIWVPSLHSKNGLKNIGIKKNIHIIPLGINHIVSAPKNTASKFRFLSVFRWTWRKAPEILIDSFIKAFEVSQAELIIKTTKNENHDFDIPQSLPSNIKIITDSLEQEDLYNLYQSSHAFVLPTRGEGWGLPITEATMFNLPVIATNWGGQLDYLSNSNSYLIEIDKMIKKPKKEIENYFAEPSTDDLINKLRFVFNNYSLALKKAEVLKKDLCENWTWEKSALRIADRLKEIF